MSSVRAAASESSYATPRKRGQTTRVIGSPPRGLGWLTVVGSLERRRAGVAGAVGDLAVEPPVVEPVDIAEGGPLDVLEPRPRALRVDQLPLVEPVEALDEGVVVAVASGADRGDDVVGGEPFRVADAEALGVARRGRCDGPARRGCLGGSGCARPSLGRRLRGRRAATGRPASQRSCGRTRRR